MSIVNRRNAFVGWAVWEVGKRLAKRRLKAAVPDVGERSTQAGIGAAVLALAAIAGVLWFWRRGDDDGDSYE